MVVWEKRSEFYIIGLESKQVEKVSGWLNDDGVYGVYMDKGGDYQIVDIEYGSYAPTAVPNLETVNNLNTWIVYYFGVLRNLRKVKKNARTFRKIISVMSKEGD